MSSKRSVARRASIKSKSTTTTAATTTKAAATEKRTRSTSAEKERQVEEIKIGGKHAFLQESSHLNDVQPPKRVRSENNETYNKRFQKEPVPLRREKSSPAHLYSILSALENFSLGSFDPAIDAFHNKKLSKSEKVEIQSSTESSHDSPTTVKNDASHHSESSSDQTKRYITSDSNQTDESGNSLSSKVYEHWDLSREYQYPRRTSLDGFSVASELSPIPDECRALANPDATGSFLENDSGTEVGMDETDISNTLAEGETSFSVVTSSTFSISKPDQHKTDTVNTATTTTATTTVKSDGSVAKKATHTMTLRKRK